MNQKSKGAQRKRKVAWGITGSGDRLEQTLNVMKKIKLNYQDQVDIRVYLSKAGEQVIKWYRLHNRLKQAFDKTYTELGPNSPFLAGDLELRKYELLLIAPATSNTVAKIAHGICDTLLTNSAIMALKAGTPVYIMPSDYKEGTVTTQLPDGKTIRIRIRKEDAENTARLRKIDGISVLENPEDIAKIFKKHFTPPPTPNVPSPEKRVSASFPP